MNCKCCGSKYTKLSYEARTIERTQYTYYCQTCKSYFDDVVEHETASGEWLITLTTDRKDRPPKVEIYRKNDGGFEINQLEEKKFLLSTTTPKICVKQNPYMRSLFSLRYYSFRNVNDEDGICFSIGRMEMNPQLTQEALKNDAMKAMHESGNIFRVKVQNSDELLNDAAAWLRTNLGISSATSAGCYVATAVYGSYDCPQVWTLRRFRDYTLAETWYGRAFVRTYYAISPTLVKWFGHTDWFKKMWKGKLDRMVADLNAEGVEDTPYEDKEW